MDVLVVFGTTEQSYYDFFNRLKGFSETQKARGHREEGRGPTDHPSCHPVFPTDRVVVSGSSPSHRLRLAPFFG